LRKPLPGEALVEDPELQQLLARAKSVVSSGVGHVEQSWATADVGIVGSPQHLADLSQIDQYRLLEKIGQGGMGAVYKALHLRLEKIVALKVLPAHRMNDADAVARFQREMKAVGRLDHPNIVRATDARETDGIHFLVMEFVEGVDLAKLVQRRGPLPVSDACELIRQVAVGLQHVYEQSLVHRDIKPSNLLLAREGRVKVLDLGLARLHCDNIPNKDLTASGQYMGTLDYMAPEQAADAKSVDIRADIYSLGCTLYHLLVGQPPFGGSAFEHPVRKLAAHYQVPVPPIRTYRPETPDQLVGILDRMLAKKPADRFATPGEVADALKSLAAACNLGSLLSSLDVTPGAQRSRGGVSREHFRVQTARYHAFLGDGA
jgi:serine/threonine protein kinase